MKLKPISQLKRKPKTLVELFKSPRRWARGVPFTACIPDEHNNVHDRHYDPSKDNSQTAIACCIQGGIALIKGIPWEHAERTEEFKKVADILGFQDNRLRIIRWNNHICQSHAEFLETLRKAGV